MNILNCPLCAKQISSSVFNDDFSLDKLLFRNHKNKNDINHDIDVLFNNEIITNIVIHIQNNNQYYININYRLNYVEYSKNIPKKLSKLSIENFKCDLLIEDMINFIDVMTVFQ